VLCGVTFGVFQYLASNYWSIPLTDIIASLASAGAVLAFTRVWHPKEGYVEATDDEPGLPAASGRRRTSPDAEGGGPVAVAQAETDTAVHDTPLDIVKAYAPYLIIIVVFVIATRVSTITGVAPKTPGRGGSGLESATHIYRWPGLHILNGKGDPVVTTFKLNVLSAAGTLLLLCGLLTMAVLQIGVGRALRTYVRTLDQLKFAILTVMAVLALGFVMNEAGETTTLGLWLAGAGGLFALLSPILGWLGVAVTGSDTSSNSLFGALQITAASQAHLSPTLLAAANSSGGVLGKMVSPQNLAIAAAAVGLEGREGYIFRRVLWWSLGFLALMCVLVYLQSTSVLSWMVP
jgi:lactate permease